MSAAESQTFNAAVVEKFGQEVTVKEIDLPQPGPNQALVKVLILNLPYGSPRA